MPTFIEKSLLLNSEFSNLFTWGGYAEFLSPGVGCVIDIGGQDWKVISVKGGKVASFQMNDKCAAGSGRFLEMILHRLEVNRAILDILLSKNRAVALNSTCVVFAESEIISLLAQGASREEILGGVAASMAARIAGQGRIALNHLRRGDVGSVLRPQRHFSPLPALPECIADASGDTSQPMRERRFAPIPFQPQVRLDKDVLSQFLDLPAVACEIPHLLLDGCSVSLHYAPIRVLVTGNARPDIVAFRVVLVVFDHILMFLSSATGSIFPNMSQLMFAPYNRADRFYKLCRISAMLEESLAIFRRYFVHRVVNSFKQFLHSSLLQFSQDSFCFRQKLLVRIEIRRIRRKKKQSASRLFYDFTSLCRLVAG